MNPLLHSIEQALDEAGFRYRVVPAELLAEMARSLVQLRDRGIMPEEIYSEYAGSLACAPPGKVGEVRSLVVVAAPSPPLKVSFELDSGQIEAVIPPTYVSTETQTVAVDLLRGVLDRAGFAAERVALPAKLLAVRVGLAEYGRNGVAYVDGLGSFVRLDVYATDAALLGEAATVEAWTPDRLPVPPRMRKCLTCAWCFHSCPTGCISATGDRIDPLRCLTYLNEHEGEWPAWLKPEAHNSLVGCMVCQRGCRVNLESIAADNLVGSEILAASFDKEETAIILKDLPEDELPLFLRRKLDLLDLAGYSRVLGRNLRALMQGATSPSQGAMSEE